MFYLSQERTHMRQQTTNPRSFHWKFYCRLRVLSFLALLPCCCLPRPLPDLLSPVPVAWCPLSLSFNKSTFRSKWKGSKWFISLEFLAYFIMMISQETFYLLFQPTTITKSKSHQFCPHAATCLPPRINLINHCPDYLLSEAKAGPPRGRRSRILWIPS